MLKIEKSVFTMIFAIIALIGASFMFPAAEEASQLEPQTYTELFINDDIGFDVVDVAEEVPEKIDQEYVFTKIFERVFCVLSKIPGVAPK